MARPALPGDPASAAKPLGGLPTACALLLCTAERAVACTQVLTHGFADDGSRMSSSMRFQADYISSELHSPEVAGGVFSALKLHADSPDEQRGGVHSVVRGVEGGLHDMLSTLGFRFV